MNFNAMRLFLSEDNIKNHLEHLHTQRLRLSILEKSVPQIKGKTITEIWRMGIDRDIKNEASSLIWYIKSHECFFNSFTETPERCKRLEKHYSSREKFLYDLFMMANDRDCGFLYVYNDMQGKPQTVYSTGNDGAYIKFEPILAIDTYEHTYFTDYGYNKERFLRNALAYLNTGLLE